MLGFWLCLFNRDSLAWGLCLLLCGGCVSYCVGVVFAIVWGLCLLLCGGLCLLLCWGCVCYCVGVLRCVSVGFVIVWGLCLLFSSEFFLVWFRINNVV